MAQAALEAPESWGARADGAWTARHGGGCGARIASGKLLARAYLPRYAVAKGGEGRVDCEAWRRLRRGGSGLLVAVANGLRRPHPNPSANRAVDTIPEVERAGLVGGVGGRFAARRR